MLTDYLLIMDLHNQETEEEYANQRQRNVHRVPTGKGERV